MRAMARKYRISFGILAFLVILAAPVFAFHHSGGVAGKGYLGIEMGDISADEVAALKLKEARGAEIVNMDHDGPACKAGLQIHDVIVQMNGQTIDSPDQLRRMLREMQVGQSGGVCDQPGWPAANDLASVSEPRYSGAPGMGAALQGS